LDSQQDTPERWTCIMGVLAQMSNMPSEWVQRQSQKPYTNREGGDLGLPARHTSTMNLYHIYSEVQGPVLAFQGADTSQRLDLAAADKESPKSPEVGIINSESSMLWDTILPSIPCQILSMERGIFSPRWAGQI
jgi:hypothetical protein